MVKASHVLPGDEIVERSTMGTITRLIGVVEVSRSCSDFSQVHIATRIPPRFKDAKHDSSLKTECWFQDSELEVKRSE